MRIIILKGPASSGKSTVLNAVHNELMSFHGLTSTPKHTLGDPKNNDFECIVTLKDQKRVAFYTMGDYFKHLLIAIEKYKYLNCEVLIIALNYKYENKLDELIKDCPHNIIDKSEPYKGNISKFRDCGHILSIM